MFATPMLGLMLALTAPATKGDAKKPPSRLVGEWAYDSCVTDERAVPCQRETLEFAADGRKFVRIGGKVREEGRYEADAAKEPAELDMLDDGFPVWQAIYRVDGDTLTICANHDQSAGRPKAFAATAKSGLILITLKRVKKKEE